LRRVAAFAILPFVAATLAYVGAPLFERSLLKQVGGSFPDGIAASFAAGAFVVAVLVTVFGGIPLYAWMSERGPIAFKKSVIAGVALGNAPFLIAAAVIVVVKVFNGSPQSDGNAWYGLAGALRTITTSTLIGAALGSVFWLVGLRGART